MIHPLAQVAESAEISSGAKIGPGVVVGENAVIGPGSVLGAHALIGKNTFLGKNNRIFPFACVGEDPQDKKYQGEESWLQIGDGNTIREFVTINRGTGAGGGTTRLGNGNWIMAYCHIAHDCQVGNGTVFANHATLAGHVSVEDGAVLGGFAAVHQFCRIGQLAMVGAGSLVFKDVPPFFLCAEPRARPHGINLVGLKRQGFSTLEIMAVRRAYRILYRQGLSFEEASLRIASLAAEVSALEPLARFLRTSRRGVIR